MGQTINFSDYVADYQLHKPELGVHKLNDFADVFATAYTA